MSGAEGLKCYMEDTCLVLCRYLGPSATGVVLDWVLAKGFNLSCQKKETISSTIDPVFGNLK